MRTEKLIRYPIDTCNHKINIKKEQKRKKAESVMRRVGICWPESRRSIPGRTPTTPPHHIPHWIHP